MITKKRIDSKVYRFNVGSILALAVTALMADKEFLEAVGVYGYIGLMIAGALVNAGIREFTVVPLAPIKEKLNPLEQALKDDDELLSE